MSGSRRFLPGFFRLLGMMILNGVAAGVVLPLLYRLFGVSGLLARQLASWPVTQAAAKWETLWPMLPGASLLFACLWFWLIVTGRTRGINWGAACFYGLMISFSNVLIAGFLTGLLNGNPLLGLLLGLVMLILVPHLLLAMIAFGLIMGLFNGCLADRWIERHRPKE
jgi:hypothetical protein